MVSPEDLDPCDSVHRHPKAKLVPGFLRERVCRLWAERSTPPMFFEAIRSERKLVGTASLNLDHRRHENE